MNTVQSMPTMSSAKSFSIEIPLLPLYLSDFPGTDCRTDDVAFPNPVPKKFGSNGAEFSLSTKPLCEQRRGDNYTEYQAKTRSEHKNGKYTV